MNKYIIIFSGVLFSAVCAAQENVESFYSDIVVDENEVSSEEVKEPTMTARKVFEMKPQKEIVPDIKAPKIEYEEEVVVEKKAGIDHEPAPFGLYWGSSIREVEEAGVDLKLFNKQGEINVYEASNLPKPIKDFEVALSFGDTNELWKIDAYYATDDTSGSYKKYYSLLEKKYGEAKEETGDYIDVSEDKGASVFGKDNMEARLSTGVAPDGSNFLHIEYINNQMLKAKEENILDAL